MLPHKPWISKISLIIARVYRLLMSWLSSCRQAAWLLSTWIVHALRRLARPTHGILKLKAHLWLDTIKVHFWPAYFKWVCKIELIMAWDRPLNLEMDSALENGSRNIWSYKYWCSWRTIMWFWLTNGRG